MGGLRTKIPMNKTHLEPWGKDKPYKCPRHEK